MWGLPGFRQEVSIQN